VVGDAEGNELLEGLAGGITGGIERGRPVL